MRDVNSEEGLGKAIKNGEEEIWVRGSLAHRIRRIWLINKTLWCVCIACLAVAIVALMALPATGGISMALTAVAGTPAACIVGGPTAASLVMVAVSGGGTAILEKMREGYEMEDVNSECIILRRAIK